MHSSGADCVKLQTFKPESITINSRKEDFIVKGGERVHDLSELLSSLDLQSDGEPIAYIPVTDHPTIQYDSLQHAESMLKIEISNSVVFTVLLSIKSI